VGSYDFTRTIADADTARILAAYSIRQGQITDPEILDDDGNVTNAAVTRDRTAQEVVDGIAEGFLAGTLANTVRTEKDIATAAAKSQVVGIEATP